MKTTLDLLTRLIEMQNCLNRVKDNPQLTDGEKAAARCFKKMVRECVPATALTTYDRMKETEPELLKCPEVFAMAVLVATYRASSPAKRKKLHAHFAAPASTVAVAPRKRSTGNYCSAHLSKLPRRGMRSLN
jgi:hypothetical protein